MGAIAAIQPGLTAGLGARFPDYRLPNHTGIARQLPILGLAALMP